MNYVSLSFRKEGNGLAGYDCYALGTYGTPKATELAARALPPAGDGKVRLVVDFIRLEGAPRCSTSGILNWCDEHDCVPIQRECVEAEMGGGEPMASVAAAILGLRGQVITGAAPDEYVGVRVVATAEPCADVASPTALFDCTKLVGCSYSCPVLLQGVSGSIDMDLDLGAVVTNPTLAAQVCEIGVDVCSRTPVKSVGPMCGSP